MPTLVTGSAGFIGYHRAERLLSRGDEVVGLDVLNDYYDVRLNEARLARLTLARPVALPADARAASGPAVIHPGRTQHRRR